MQRQAVPYNKIIFVCVNQKEGDKPCCAARGSVDLHAKLKEMARGLKGVRVSKSGCLGRCDDGPNIMVFPDNVWYSGVQESDLEGILQDLAPRLDAQEE